MLSIFSIVLLCTGICKGTADLLSYPIVGTSYMVHFDKQLRKTPFEATLYDENVIVNGTSFYAKLKNGLFEDKTKTKVVPLLPKHPLFVTRKTDSETGIRIEIDWSKDNFESQRTTDLTLEMILYNYRGDKLGILEIKKDSNTGKGNKQIYDTQMQPGSEGLAYSANGPADPSDLLVAVFRIKIKDNKGPWVFLTVFPDQFAIELKTMNDWSIEEIIYHQSTFMAMSMLVTETEWIEHAHRFAMLTLFSRAAGMVEADFKKDKYLSVIAVPKSGGGTYNIRDIGQRSGAGFGFLYWNINGHRFSDQFLNNFKSKGQEINKDMFQAFVRTCFDYGTILDARSKAEMDADPSKEAQYRNQANTWSYEFDGHPISGSRRMIAGTETVEEISWTLDSDKHWKTTADGKIRDEQK